MAFEKYGNGTLTTTYQQIHDGSRPAYILCGSAVLLADSDAPGSTEFATSAANTYVVLKQGSATFAKVASSTASFQIFR